MRLKGYIYLCIVCCFYWILDSIWSYLSFELNLRTLIFSEPASYFDTLLLQVPPYQVVSRIMVLVLFAILGAMIIEYFIKKHEADRALRESEERYRSLYDNALVAIFRRPINQEMVTAVNNVGVRIYGYSSKEEFLKEFISIDHYAHSNDRSEMMEKIILSGEIHNKQIQFKRKDGTFFWGEVSARLDQKKQELEAVILDISERKKAEESLRASLKEKEVLLKEIHHRVRNNLQMVESLLNLQLSENQDLELSSALTDCKNRVRSMALVHETLYQTPDLSTVDIGHYIEKLVSLQLMSMKYPHLTIDVSYKIEPLPLEMDSIIACGLITNELVNNALKHAFIERNTGYIEIALQAVNGDQAKLTIKDNGVGIPLAEQDSEKSSLGLKIVKILAEQQLDGNLSITKEPGSVFRIQFPLQKGQIDEITE